MSFSTYHLYVDLISQRDQYVLIIAMLICSFFELMWFLSRFRPAWVKPAIWIFGVGGYYATLAAMAVYLSSRS